MSDFGIETHLNENKSAGEMALREGALVALAEELGSVPITHIVVHNHL